MVKSRDSPSRSNGKRTGRSYTDSALVRAPSSKRWGCRDRGSNLCVNWSAVLGLNTGQAIAGNGGDDVFSSPNSYRRPTAQRYSDSAVVWSLRRGEIIRCLVFIRPRYDNIRRYRIGTGQARGQKPPMMPAPTGMSGKLTGLRYRISNCQSPTQKVRSTRHRLLKTSVRPESAV